MLRRPTSSAAHADAEVILFQAFDEDSARKKVEKAFATGRILGVDVEAGAGVWTYAVVPPQDASGS